jgi:hypothetical protein
MEKKSLCAVHQGNSRKGNCFYLFGCLVNAGKNVIAIIMKLLRAHQVSMKVVKMPLGDRDVERPGPYVAVGLALLVVPAGFGPGHHILSQTAPHIPG